MLEEKKQALQMKGAAMSNLKRVADAPPGMKRNITRRMWQICITMITIAIVLFVSAWSVRWIYAWLYIAAYLLIVLAVALTLPSEVIAERGSRKENTESWDKLLRLLLLFTTLFMYITAGLDFRFRWSDVSTGLHVLGMVIFLLGNAFNMWAMNANLFFSTDVRIQSDRGQKVCTGGPYRIVRHPGYLGMILYNLATPLFLGSLWALIPAAAITAAFIVRTGMEDKTLQKKLAGYAAYAERTRYRLFPGL
jgi:protein-S-isoprenylcysteine O-methyltransferase Ste14